MQNTTTTHFTPVNLPEALLDLHKQLLTHQTPEAAWAIVKEFFFCFSPGGIQSEMWQLLSGALTSKQMPVLKKPVSRHNLIFFYEFTLLFTQAVNLLLQQQKEQHAAAQ